MNDLTKQKLASKSNFWILFSCWTVLAIFFLLQFRSIFTETINWDEFALFFRAKQALDTGTLGSGGRPGLTTIVLMPIIKLATSEVNAIHAGRVIWFFFTLIFVIGTYFYLKTALQAKSGLLPFFGVALLIMNPFFIRCSVQVRTDQMALAFSVLACICLLRRTLWWHVLAATLFGIGYLSTQKALYVMGLGLLIAYLPPIITGPLRAKYNGFRLIVFGLVFAILVKGWPLLISTFFFQTSSGISLETGLNVFDYYSKAIGYAYYVINLQFWCIHLTLGLVLLVHIGVLLRSRKRFPPNLIIAISVLSLGIFVMLFHKAALPYFLMVLGLFPAIGFTFFLKSVSDMYPVSFAKETAQACWLLTMFFALLGLSLPYILAQQRDTQKIQRESLDYVRNNFYGHFEGFHPEGALFQQPSKSPFKIYFAQSVSGNFEIAEPKKQENIKSFVHKFYENRIGFLIHTFRMEQFPDEIREFWKTHYVPWKASVCLAGAFLDSKANKKQSVDLVVAGHYVWIPDELEHPILIDGYTVAPHKGTMLKAGEHVVDFNGNSVSGQLVLEPGDSPNSEFSPIFYVHGFNFQ